MSETRIIKVEDFNLDWPQQVLDSLQKAREAAAFATPTERAEAIFHGLTDADNWKLAVRPFITYDKQLASEVADCIVFYCGGVEQLEERTRWGTAYVVQSMGYYHYVGA